jgi:hypothetical protein
LVRVDGKPAGFFLLRPSTKRGMELHTHLLPPCRGALALKAGRAMLTWCYGQGILCLSTWSEPGARQVEVMASRAGFVRTERETNGRQWWEVTCR